MQTLLSRFKDTPIMDMSRKARKKGSLVRGIVSYDQSLCFVQTCVVDYLEHKYREIVLLQFAFLDKSLVDGILQQSEGRGIGNQ